MPRIDHHVLKKSLSGLDDECGDTGFVREGDGECFFALIDGVGHGREAHEAAMLAENFLTENAGPDLVEMMQELHERLKGGRGAVAMLCRLDIATGVLRYVGIGNIAVRIFGADEQRLLSRDGIIGYMMATPREQETRLYPGDILVSASDGVREHFDPDEFPGLLTGSAREIATRVVEQLGKGDDDASCLVVRVER